MMDVSAIPDLIRLISIPFFAWAAWQDIKTRRVTSEIWKILAILGIGLLLWDTYSVIMTDRLHPPLFLIYVGFSLGIVAPAGYLFARVGAFGWADAKAIIVLAVLFPIYPTYDLGAVAFPIVVAAVGVFSLTILSNTVIIALVYPIYLSIWNGISGRISPAMAVGIPVAWNEVEQTHGRLLESKGGFTKDGLDLDALRMYLRWRNETLASLRNDPETSRNPTSLPETPGSVGDGAIRSDGGSSRRDESDYWGADAFLGDVEYAYGTTPETLRNGLDVLVSNDQIWISPGIPFIVPIFLGLITALTFGDILTYILTALGLL